MPATHTHACMHTYMYMHIYITNQLYIWLCRSYSSLAKAYNDPFNTTDIRNLLEIQVDGDKSRVYKPDHKDTMRSSKIHRHSFINVCVAEPDKDN